MTKLIILVFAFAMLPLCQAEDIASPKFYTATGKYALSPENTLDVSVDAQSHVLGYNLTSTSGGGRGQDLEVAKPGDSFLFYWDSETKTLWWGTKLRIGYCQLLNQHDARTSMHGRSKPFHDYDEFPPRPAVFIAELERTVPTAPVEPTAKGKPVPLYQELENAAADARQRYDASRVKMSAEKARLRYVTDLTEIAYRYMAIEKGEAWLQLEEGWEALNHEIVRYPAPKKSDSKALSKLLVGKWESPRHDYVYSMDGTWHIQGNQWLDGGRSLTIILLDGKYFVFTDGPEGAFFEKRITK
jgi:hypothetical protein